MSRLFVTIVLFCVAVQAPAQTIRETVRSLTGNSGVYSNQIPAATPQSAYTEICINNGSVVHDQHEGGEPTNGGNCLPGMVGWILERQERAELPWEMARMECLKEGMRLPEVFEWKFSCKNAAFFGLSDMESVREWTSNWVEVGDNSLSNTQQIYAPTMGLDSCTHGDKENVANANGNENLAAFRCAR